MKQPYSAKLETYLALLKRYHSTLDLVSPRAFDSLDQKIEEAGAYADFIAARASCGDRILDLGSGAGLPGVVLALTLPEHPLTLVERRQRRASFLKIVVSQLELRHVGVVARDVRHYSDDPYTWITAQAVGALPLLYCLTRHLHTPEVTLVTRRGALEQRELEALEAVSGDALAVQTGSLPTHGKLVALRVRGGHPCPSSA